MDFLSFLQTIGSPKLRLDTRRYLADSAQRAARRQPFASEGERAATSRVFLSPGIDSLGHPVRMPLASFYGHGLILGASGAGKSLAAASLMGDLLRLSRGEGSAAFGLIDAKGELFERMRVVAAEAQLSTVLTLDFSGDHPASYALLKARAGETAERLVERRMEVFDDVLGRDSQLSLRMSRMLRHVLHLAVEQDLAFPMLERLFSEADLAPQLAVRSKNARVKTYFANDFARERHATLPALVARIDFLLRHEALRLSFGAEAFIDFTAAMNRGTPVLINAGGPTIPRSVSQVIQSLVISDIRQAIFSAERTPHPYTWFIDEAQCLFAQRADVDNLSAILTMARSFGAHVVLITQSLSAACPTRDFFNTLDTNFRWLILFRCGVEDAGLIEPAMPADGRMPRELKLGGRLHYETAAQAVQRRLQQVTNLPPRIAYFWLRGAPRKAVLMKTHFMPPARAASFLGMDRGQEGPSADAVRQSLEAQEARLRRLTLRPVAKGRSGKAAMHDMLARLERQLADETDGETR